MNLFTLIEQVRSAHQLASAFENGRKPSSEALAKLGLPSEMGQHFKR